MIDEVRFARQLALPEIGPVGQARLAETTALVVGLGGLGCPAAIYLAGAGVGTLLLNDFDTVDASNLPRQILFTADDVGRSKVAAARAQLKRLSPATAVIGLEHRLDADGLADAVARADVVLDGTDNFATRLAVNAACVAARTPLVSGAAVRLEGQAAVFANRGGGPCYRCVYDDADEWLGDCRGNGVLAPVPGVIGSLMAVEAISIALGARAGLDGRLLLWDARAGDLRVVGLKADPACPVCGAAA